MARRAANLLSVGIVVLVFAIVWWWITYRDVVLYAYLSIPEAGLCLVGRSDICDLARSLCRGEHPGSIVKYWWGTFWIGMLVASASLVLHNSRPR
ncbi:hypothetical protein ACVIHI_008923 [Bradyrhizobium sp. USDA 4524]|nr:hypothetical protein [Bradyrhizobium sp. USDA 4538]MCP1907068.1 hypothetical protein [Bradyrhizobium sp. USDA 4537]MCP1985544.1 hypothetical protein [Bradyrhizobium sp. USDA 4539]